eukprot:4707410-Alexandrium_andersonii.AAC.1
MSSSGESQAGAEQPGQSSANGLEGGRQRPRPMALPRLSPGAPFRLIRLGASCICAAKLLSGGAPDS